MIRLATAQDIPRLLQLMQQLAEFEGYAEKFCITEQDLYEYGFNISRPAAFSCLVAEIHGDLVGYALSYLIPFTFDLRPTLVLKELFVEEYWRGQRCGTALLHSVIAQGLRLSVRLVRWQVLPDNEAAKRFYRKIGASPDMDWESWLYEIPLPQTGLPKRPL